MEEAREPVAAPLDRDEARSYFLDAQRRIGRGEKEDVLRYLFCTRLTGMFPTNPWWIEEHAAHAEGNSVYRIGDTTHHGFADVLIGKTAVEYERDLGNRRIFDEGYGQVLDYCAGLLNEGVSERDIVGVLSDTVLSNTKLSIRTGAREWDELPLSLYTEDDANRTEEFIIMNIRRVFDEAIAFA